MSGIDKLVHAIKDIEAALLDAVGVKKTAATVAVLCSKQLDTITTFCNWFKLNGGCDSCPMYQLNEHTLKWECTENLRE